METERKGLFGRKRVKKIYRNWLGYLWGEWIRPIAEAVIIALVITTFVITTVGIQGRSDLPTVNDGERVLVPKYEMWLARLGLMSFKRGDLVVLKPPQNSPQSERALPIIGNLFPNLTYRPFFIKRIVAVGGDRLRLEKGQLYVNGIKVEETHTVPYWQKLGSFDSASYLANSKEWSIRDWEGGGTLAKDGTFTIPKGYYFVMGDNRSPGGSEDSRVFGPVPLDAFAGRATFVWWPPVARDDKGNFTFNMRTLPRPETFERLNKQLENEQPTR